MNHHRPAVRSRRVILDLRSRFSHKSKITQSRTQDASGRSQSRSARAFLLDGSEFTEATAGQRFR
jgi:hypothetical protein